MNIINFPDNVPVNVKFKNTLINGKETNRKVFNGNRQQKVK